MKKFALIFMIGISSLAANAQNAIMTMPTDKTPATVTVLGRDPQFPPLRHLDNAGQVYDQLKAMGENPRYSSEINSLFTAMGYNGVSDPDFDRNDVQAVNLPYGAIGMMGNGKNTYKYSIIMLPNQSTTNAWKVDAKSGTDLYFLAECGNSFNYANPDRVSVVERETVVKDYSGKGKMKVRVLARTKSGGECSWCSKCEDDVQTVVLSEENVDDIPVAKDGSSYPVKTIYLDVDRKTFRKIQAGEVNATASKVNYNTLNNVASRR